MTYAIGDPAHIQKGHNDLVTAIQEQADRYMITVTLPDTAHLSDTGHVDDHNLMVAALQAIADGAGGFAVLSDTPTDTYTDADGTWNCYLYTADGTLTVTTGGYVDALIVSGGAGGKAALWNGMGSWSAGMMWLDAGTHTITVGAGGPGNAATFVAAQGGASRLGPHYSQNSAPGASSIGGGVTSSITGTALTYAASAVDAAPVANTGNGGSENLSREGSSGVVIVRVRA